MDQFAIHGGAGKSRVIGSTRAMGGVYLLMLTLMESQPNP